jgi:cellulose synthase/poly-beta-1,6-N-acetylglucosamine synthase-like glycosyltransferase
LTLQAKISSYRQSRTVQVLSKKESTERKQRFDDYLVIVCAYNEERTLPYLLESLKGRKVLVIDDGSLDKTAEIAKAHGATVISHETRLGKAASLADGISYAVQNSFEIAIEVDADAIPKIGTISKILKRLEKEKVAAVSCKQIPLGRINLAYHIDELIWAMLTHGKSVQMAKSGYCHLGGVLVGFKPDLVDSIEGSVNDDEQVGISLVRKGFIIEFEENAVVYFDASTCIGHIFERRRRMYYGHMRFSSSTAPSMNISTSLGALGRAVHEDLRRLVYVLPTIVLDLVARLAAWKDSRKKENSRNYSRWVTTYEKKNSTFVIRDGHSN